MTPVDEFAQRLHRLAAAATEYRAAAIDLGEWFATRMTPRDGLLASENTDLRRLVESLPTVESMATVMETISCGTRCMGALLPMLIFSSAFTHGQGRVLAAVEAGILAAKADCPSDECVKSRSAAVEAAREIVKRASGAP